MEDSVAVSRQSGGSLAAVRRRMLVLRDPPVWPFVWRGLLPLLVFAALAAFALLPFARDWIEATVRGEVRVALDARGMQWVTLDVSGQNVRLGGTAPKTDAGDHALAVAREATCPTWLGRRVCAVDVSGQFGAPAVAAAAQPEPAEVKAQAAACDKRFAEIMRSSRIEFATSSAVISPTSRELLSRLAEAQKHCPGVVAIEGHTDSIGDAEHNQTLSEARAASVREALIALGVPGDRLVARGYGARHPLAGNETPASRAKNRRIEFRTEVDD